MAGALVATSSSAPAVSRLPNRSCVLSGWLARVVAAGREACDAGLAEPKSGTPPGNGGAVGLGAAANGAPPGATTAAGAAGPSQGASADPSSGTPAAPPALPT